jgi:uncharacterized radical SAM superfamily protein
MRPAVTPARLSSEIERLAASGGSGLLVSGGCDANGMVPMEAFIEALICARRRGLKVNMHPGMCDEGRAALLAPAADSVSLDLVCDDHAARATLHLASARGHMATIDAWAGKGPRVVPHLLIGLGSEGSEMEAIAFCRERGIRRLVLLALMPPKGRGDVPERRLLKAAASAMESIPEVVLGCMRPRGSTGSEISCLEAGVRHMANPSRAALDRAEEMGCEVRVHHACCSLP